MARPVDAYESLKTVSALEGTKRIELPAQRVEGYKLTLEGTNASGETLKTSDLGGVRIRRPGQEKILNVRFEDLFDFQRTFRRQNPEAASAAGGAIRLVTYIENRLPGVTASVNGYDEQRGGSLELDFDSVPGGTSGLNQICDSLTCTVRSLVNPAYAEVQTVRMDSLPVIRGGAGRSEVEGIDEQNVAMIFVRDTDGVVTAASLYRQTPAGEEIVFDETPVKDIEEHFVLETDKTIDPNWTPMNVAAAPSLIQARNEGVALYLTTSGASSAIRVVYAYITSGVNGTLSTVQKREAMLQRLPAK